MKIYVHDQINPNYPIDAYCVTTSPEQRDGIVAFMHDSAIAKNQIAEELNCLPHELIWSPVPNTGTDIEVCAVIGETAMCNEWELKRREN